MKTMEIVILEILVIIMIFDKLMFNFRKNIEFSFYYELNLVLVIINNLYVFWRI